MAVKVGDLFVELGLKLNKFSKGIEDMQKGLKDVADDMKNVGATMTATITAPIVGMGVAALSAFGNFEQGMNRVRAVTQQSGAAFEAMNQTALELGRTTQFSASQAADAMGFLAMAGFQANEIISAMPSTLQLAAAGQMDLGRAADITSNILTGYGLAVEDLSHANDVLVTGMTSTNVDLTQLGEAFKFVGPVARAAGVQFEETAAAIGLLGNAGIQGSMAGTSLRKAITSLIAPSKQQAEIMDKLGLSVTDTFGKFVGFAEVVEQLEGASAGAADMMNLFGQRAGPAMQSLVDQGSDAIKRMTTLMEENEGVAERVAKTQLEGWKGAMTKLKSAVEGTLIAIGDVLAPTAHKIAEAFTFLAGKVTAIAELFKRLPQSIQLGVIAFAGIAAAIGPVIFIFGSLLGAVANLKSLGPILARVGGAMSTFGANAQKMGAAKGALVSLRGAAALAAPALTTLGIAVVALAAVEVGKGLWNVADAIGGWSKASRDAAKNAKVLIDATKSEERILKELQQSLIDAKNGVHDFSEEHRRSATQLGVAKTAWEQLKDAVLNSIAPWRGAKQALDRMADTIRLFKGETKDMGDVVAREFKRINGSILAAAKADGDADIAKRVLIRTMRKKQKQEEASRRATEATTRAEEAKTEVGRKAERNLQARIDMLKRYEDRAKNIIKIQQKLDDMDAEILSTSRDLQNMFKAVEQSMKDVGKGVEIDIIVPLRDRLSPAITGRIKEAQDLAAAFESLGVKSTAALVKGAQITEEAFLRVKDAYEQGKTSAVDFYNALVANLKKQLEVALATGQVTEQIEEDLRAAQIALSDLGVDLGENVKKTNEWGEAWQMVSTALTDMGGKIADLIWSGGNLGEVMVNTFKEIGKAVTRLALEAIAGDLVDSLKSGENALFAFGESLKKIFGLGGVADAAGGAGGAGGATAAIKNVGGAIMEMTNVIGLVTGIVSAVFDVLSFFQGRRMEKDIGRIEVTSREIKNINLNQMEKFNEWLPWLGELKFLSSIDTRVLAILDKMNGGAGGEDLEAKAREDLANATEEAVQQSDKLTERLEGVAESAEKAADAIEEVSGSTQDYSKALHKNNDRVEDAVDTSEDLTGATKDLERSQDGLVRETEDRFRSEQTAYDGATRQTATYTRSLNDLARTAAGAATIVSGGMSDLAVNARFAGEEIFKASAKIKAAAGSVGAITSVGGPITLAGPGGPIIPNQFPAPGAGGGGSPGASYTPYNPWENLSNKLNTRSASELGNTSLQLQVNVNNADAQQVADKMIDTWRRRGIDL